MIISGPGFGFAEERNMNVPPTLPEDLVEDGGEKDKTREEVLRRAAEAGWSGEEELREFLRTARETDAIYNASDTIAARIAYASVLESILDNRDKHWRNRLEMAQGYWDRVTDKSGISQ